ncbi:MAG: DUF3124 domain-containing protein [Candidatus Scalindua sp.]|nr:DUF3124 domain-containing protein [Candidatus Scalindua sp.]
MKSRLVKQLYLYCFFVLCSSTSFADTQTKLSAGQTIYVPIYSNVFSGPKGLPFNLSAILSIRNIDLYNSITITSVEYYDNAGKLLRKYTENPLVLRPLASNHIIIKESDGAGGFGANFIVRWKSVKEINAPIVETVMIGVRSGQGISFVSQGQVIKEDTK